MTFDEYQGRAIEFARYPRQVMVEYINTEDERYVDSEPLPFTYPVMALAEEAGEVVGKVAKYIRKQEYNATNYLRLREDVKKELGDVLWQLNAVATEFDLDLRDIAEANLSKLSGREERGTIVGEGDSR